MKPRKCDPLSDEGRPERIADERHPLSAKEQKEVEEFYVATVALTRKTIYLRMGGNSQEIDDVQQRTYVEIMRRWRDIRELRPYGKQVQWLKTTTTNVIMSEMRARALDRGRNLPDHSIDHTPDILAASLTSGTDMKILYRELWKLISLLLDGREQQVLARDLLGLTTKEIAAELGISSPTVRGYRMKALEKLSATPTVRKIREEIREANT